MCVRSLADHLKRWLGSTAFVANDLVLFVQNENARLMNGRFFGRVTREIHYRDAVANFSKTRGRAVELDDSPSGFAVDYIGLEPLPIAQIANKNFLIRKQPDKLSQIG